MFGSKVFFSRGWIREVTNNNFIYFLSFLCLDLWVLLTVSEMHLLVFCSYNFR
jgi:hypothetical protein